MKFVWHIIAVLLYMIDTTSYPMSKRSFINSLICPNGKPRLGIGKPCDMNDTLDEYKYTANLSDDSEMVPPELPQEPPPEDVYVIGLPTPKPTSLLTTLSSINVPSEQTKSSESSSTPSSESPKGTTATDMPVLSSESTSTKLPESSSPITPKLSTITESPASSSSVPEQSLVTEPSVTHSPTTKEHTTVTEFPVTFSPTTEETSTVTEVPVTFSPSTEEQSPDSDVPAPTPSKPVYKPPSQPTSNWLWDYVYYIAIFIIGGSAIRFYFWYYKKSQQLEERQRAEMNALQLEDLSKMPSAFDFIHHV